MIKLIEVFHFPKMNSGIWKNCLHKSRTALFMTLMPDKVEKTIFSLRKDFANWRFASYGFGFAGATVAVIAKLFVLILVIIHLTLNHMGSVLCQKLR